MTYYFEHVKILCTCQDFMHLPEIPRIRTFRAPAVYAVFLERCSCYCDALFSERKQKIWLSLQSFFMMI